MPQADRKRRHDARRAAEKPWRRWYQSPEWRRLRSNQMQRDPWCAACAKHGRRTKATVADHITPHRGDRRLFFDARNLRSLCKSCHDGPKSQEERLGYSTAIGPDGLPEDPRHPFFAGG